MEKEDFVLLNSNYRLDKKQSLALQPFFFQLQEYLIVR